MGTPSRGFVVAVSLLACACASGPLRAQTSAAPPRGLALRSASGDEELRVVAVFQARYMRTALAAGDADPDERRAGFQYRRIQLDLQGHVRGPRWTYRLRIDASNGGTLAPAHAWVAYDLTDRLNLRVGQTKPAFLHEEAVSGPQQLAAERSWTADYFTTDFAQLLQLTWKATDRTRLVGTLHTGSYSYRTDFDRDLGDFAAAVRADRLLFAHEPAVGWSRLRDFEAWSGGGALVAAGAAVDYERAERTGSSAYPDLLKWTADVNVKAGRASLFAAVVGQRFTVDGPLASDVPAGLDGAGQLGFVGQASVFLAPDRWSVFGRLETIDFDGAYYRLNQGAVQSGSRTLAHDRFSAVTVGGTWYLARHDAKITVDVVRAGDAVPVSNTGTGLLRSDGSAQTALRTQLQIVL